MPSKIAVRIGPIDGIAQSRGMDVAAGFEVIALAV
jgi:hypothetical protein